MIAIKRILFDNFTQVNGGNCAKKRNKNTKRSTKIIIKNYTWQKSTSPKSPYQRKKVYSQFEKKSRNNFYGKLKSSSKIPWSAKIICNLKKNEHKKSEWRNDRHTGDKVVSRKNENSNGIFLLNRQYFGCMLSFWTSFNRPFVRVKRVWF